MKLYLAGPMRGYLDSNFPAFDEAAERLRSAGYEVFNPADHDRKLMAETGRRHEDLTIRELLAVDLAWICEHADGVALLQGWGESLGAQAEVRAAMAVGIPYNWVVHWLQAARVPILASA